MLRQLEAEFIVLCRVAFGIRFKVTDWDPDNGKDTIEIVGTSISLGTISNLIFLEEEMDTFDTKGKAKVHEISDPAKPPPN
jgi:hypothetical protein